MRYTNILKRPIYIVCTVCIIMARFYRVYVKVIEWNVNKSASGLLRLRAKGGV
jgi:hypothetical protein